MPTYQARRANSGDWEVFAGDERGALSRTHERTFYKDRLNFLYVGWLARRCARQLSKPPKPKKVKAVTYSNGKRVKS